MVLWCQCQAALDGLAAVNSAAVSRLWKWRGRAYANDTQPNDHTVTQTSQLDGISFILLTAVLSLSMT